MCWTVGAMSMAFIAELSVSLFSSTQLHPTDPLPGELTDL